VGDDSSLKRTRSKTSEKYELTYNINGKEGEEQNK
jgi:hypothetical protein